MENKNDTRDIPPMPGGGSWTFDTATWTWLSNHPVEQDSGAAWPVLNDHTTEE